MIDVETPLLSASGAVFAASASLRQMVLVEHRFSLATVAHEHERRSLTDRALGHMAGREWAKAATPRQDASGPRRPHPGATSPVQLEPVVAGRGAGVRARHRLCLVRPAAAIGLELATTIAARRVTRWPARNSPGLGASTRVTTLASQMSTLLGS